MARLALAGGKAGTLAQLYQAGYPVPDGFVVLPAAFAGDELQPVAWTQVHAHLQRMRVDQEVGRYRGFAVRSSAAGEDSASASFAGAFETVLGVDTDEAFNDSLTGDYVWSAVNIGEAMAVVMTPFTWSLVGMAFDELNAVPGYAPVGNIGGRAYQNVTVMTSMMRVLGWGNGDLVRELGGVREEYLETMDQYIVPLPEATVWTVLPGALRVLHKQRAALKDLQGFLSGNPAWCDAARQRIGAMTAGEELVRFASELTDRCLATFWRTVATAWDYAERNGKLRRELEGLVGAGDADLLLSNVSVQGQLLASLGPMVGLARVSRGELSRQDYLAQWGHRGPQETETSIPRPAEDRDWLEGQLAEYERAPVNPEALLAQRQAKGESAWGRLQQAHPRRAKRLRRRLALAAGAARSPEAVRSEFTRLVWVARAWALRVGALTGIGDGAFFLTLGELLGLLVGQEGPVATIPARQRTYERYKALPPYPLIIRGQFEPFAWAADPDRRSDVYDAGGLLQQVRLKARREDRILGMPGSAGRAEGTVRRLERPDQGGDLRPGEILVTSQTNIGWTPDFPRAAAIVTDVGAPLSHAAIVARELGIPAVVNCGDATARLRNGDRVRVDGGQGVVEIVAQGQRASWPGSPPSP